MSAVGPFSRPLDRAGTLRVEFGHNAAIPKLVGEGFHAEYVAAYCPLHPVPDEFQLELRERGGHGGRLILECRGGCLPSAILAELRRLERWQLLRSAAWPAS